MGLGPLAHVCDGLKTACDGFGHLLGGHGAGNALTDCMRIVGRVSRGKQLEAITKEVEGRQEAAGIMENRGLVVRLLPRGLGKLRNSDNLGSWVRLMMKLDE